MKKVILFFLCLIFVAPIQASHEHDSKVYDTIILGDSPAALIAALYLIKVNMQPLLIGNHLSDKLVSQPEYLQNYLENMEIFETVCSANLQHHAMNNHVFFRKEEIIEVDLTSKPYQIITQSSDDTEERHTFKAHTCIIAMGTIPNYLNIRGEKEYWNKGVINGTLSNIGDYRGKTVAVFGYGDIVLSQVDYLATLAEKVYLLIKNDGPKISNQQQLQKVIARDNVEVLYNVLLEEIFGDDENIHEILISDAKEEYFELSIQRLYITRGCRPNTDLFENQLQLNEAGYICLKNDQETSKEGVFAAGSITEICEQMKMVGESGMSAAIQAHEYFLEHMDEVSSDETFNIVKDRHYQNNMELVIEPHNEQELLEIIQNSQLPVILNFHAIWCRPCRLLEPVFNNRAAEYSSQFTFVKANINDMPHFLNTYNIKSIPALLVFNQREIIEKIEGQRDITRYLSEFNVLE